MWSPKCEAEVYVDCILDCLWRHGKVLTKQKEERRTASQLHNSTLGRSLSYETTPIGTNVAAQSSSYVANRIDALQVVAALVTYIYAWMLGCRQMGTQRESSGHTPHVATNPIEHARSHLFSVYRVLVWFYFFTTSPSCGSHCRYE